MEKIFNTVMLFFESIFKKSDRLKYNIPRVQNDVWYNYSLHSKGKYPKVFDENGKYIQCEIGQKLQMGETACGKKIYYKIKNIRSRRGGDWLYSSDSFRCDMTFCEII